MRKTLYCLLLLAFTGFFWACGNNEKSSGSNSLRIYSYDEAANEYTELSSRTNIKTATEYILFAFIVDKDGNNITNGRRVTWTSSDTDLSFGGLYTFSSNPFENPRAGVHFEPLPNENLQFSVIGNPAGFKTKNRLTNLEPVRINIECGGMRKIINFYITN